MKYLNRALFLAFIFSSVFIPTLVFADLNGTSPSLPNPLAGNITDIYSFVRAVLYNIVLPIGAVIVVFFIIYSGYLFVTAGGSEDKISKAKHTFLWVVIGAAVLLGSVAIAAGIQNTVCQIAPNIPMCQMGPPPAP